MHIYEIILFVERSNIYCSDQINFKNWVFIYTMYVFLSLCTFLACHSYIQYKCHDVCSEFMKCMIVRRQSPLVLSNAIRVIQITPLNWGARLCKQTRAYAILHNSQSPVTLLSNRSARRFHWQTKNDWQVRHILLRLRPLRRANAAIVFFFYPRECVNYALLPMFRYARRLALGMCA